MDSALLSTLALSGLLIAFLHAALPSHWLPFVLAGRTQGWSTARTLSVTAAAGLGHALFTLILGALIVSIGFAADRWIGKVFPWLAGAALILVGLMFLLRGHHDHPHDAGAAAANLPDRSVVLGLLAMLTFSPCEGFLPVYVAGVPGGWSGFVLLSLVLLAGTLAGMIVFTWLSLLGLKRLNWHWLEHNEHRVTGAVLCAIGVLVFGEALTH